MEDVDERHHVLLRIKSARANSNPARLIVQSIMRHLGMMGRAVKRAFLLSGIEIQNVNHVSDIYIPFSAGTT